MRRMRRWISRFAAVAVLAGGLVLGAGPAHADDEDVQDFTFDRVDALIELSRDADGAAVATITETYVAVFPDRDQNRGMQLRIPTDYDWVPLDPQIVSVTDGDGSARPFETDRDGGALVVTSAVPEGEYVHGRQTYAFTYAVENVAKAMDNGLDEFYWDVLGHEWQQPIGTFAAQIRVDPELAGEFTGDMRCYGGAYGSTDGCDNTRAPQDDGSLLISFAKRGIEPEQGVTVAIGFEPGTFASFDTSIGSSPWALAQLGGGALALGALGWAGAIRARRLRDEPGRPTVIAEYEPPAGIDAATAAAILGRTGKIVPAEVLEQAVAGALRIVEAKGGVFGGSKFTAELIDASRADENGLIILRGLFGDDLAPGATFEFGTTSAGFSEAAQSLMAWATARDHALRGVLGLRRGAVPLILFGIALVIVVVCGIVAIASYVSPLVPALVIGFAVLALFAIFAILWRRPLTAEGAEIRDHLRGLEQFIRWAEEDRIRMLQSPEGAERRSVDPSDPRQMLVLYERLLPFAVVFGQEKQWAERLAVLYPSGAPDWYIGAGPMPASAFAAGIGSMSSATVFSMSSSSGGSTGGGFSGGGGGGTSGGGV